MAINLGNNYPNLPGMLVQFKDGGQSLRFNETESLTDSMLILGTSVDGPVMEPVAVEMNTAELVFGSELRQNGTPNGSTLVHAFKQAYEAGCTDIRLMRISGSQAEMQIQAQAKNVTTNERVDEDLTIIQGNDLTTIALTTPSIILNTVKVYVKGIELKDGVSVTKSGEVTTVEIAKNTCEAGATILVKFKHTTSVEVTENLVVSESKKVLLKEAPIVNSIVVTKDGVTIPAESYTVSGKEITFVTSATQDVKKKGRTATDVAQGDTVKIVYNTAVEADGNENGNADGSYLTATSLQTMLVDNVPEEGSLILYVDEAKVLDNSSFEISGRTLKIRKERFIKGQKISVSYYIEKAETVKRAISLKSIFAGSVYNTGTVKVEGIYEEVPEGGLRAGETPNKIGVNVIITKPQAKVGTGEKPQSYSSFNFPTFGDLVDAINENNSIYKATTDTPATATEELQISNSYFESGDDGVNLTKDELYKALSGTRNAKGEIVKPGAYQLLENYQTDYVVPVGAYADDKLQDRHENFAYELALFCAAISQKNKTTHGMISMAPLKDTSLVGVQEHAEYLKKYNNHYFMRDRSGSIIRDSENQPFDLGKFISVVVGPTPLFPHKVNALRGADPAVMYCAFNTTLLPQSAATNKMLLGSRGIKYTYSNSQLNDIVGNRMVVFGTKFARNGQTLEGCFVIDAPTAARAESEYTRLTTFNVIRSVADSIRDVSDPFIGEPNTTEQRNALSAAISKRLDLLTENGVIIEYSFNVVADQRDLVLGHARLELGIVAPQELRKITTIIGLKR